MPVLTASATRFVGAATFSALASEPARLELFDDDRPDPSHRARPARGSRAHRPGDGTRDRRLTPPGSPRTCSWRRCSPPGRPVLVCPAMHTEMWEHPAVQENLATLRRRGVHVLEPDIGRLAGGDVGTGRLPETDVIVARRRLGSSSAPRNAGRAGLRLSGRRVLVTAGGTREPIDPVRFLANRSSGRQGHALAGAAAELGAEVTLVTTSTCRHRPESRWSRSRPPPRWPTPCSRRAGQADLVVMAAAVADYRPPSRRPRSSTRPTGSPRSVSSRRSTSSPSSAGAGIPDRCSWGSPPRRTPC